MKHVFDPFYTTRRVGVGAEMGMVIAYQIMKRHRGGIEVACQPGPGTIFSIGLPLDTQPLDPNRQMDPVAC